MKDKMNNRVPYVLNIGSGSINLDRFNYARMVVHLDSCYRSSTSMSAEEVEKFYIELDDKLETKHVLCNSDVFEFIERFPFKFHEVYAERIFEHMEFASGQIGRLLEGINRITTDETVLNIVVPNMALIAQMILDYEQNNSSYTSVELANRKLIINTECHNIRQDPHLSSWTPSLAKEYIEGEGTWKISQIVPKTNFAGRDIYMWIQCIKTYKDKQGE